MINEVYEAECYLRGENLDQHNVYRMTMQIVRLLLQQGLEPCDIRERVFEWANEHGYFLEFSVNTVIYLARDRMPALRGDVDVFISEEDVANIARHVDSRVCKRVALAMLCYSKAAADKHGDFQMSSVQLGAWIGVAPSNIRSRYIKELVDFAYLAKTTDHHRHKGWQSGDKKEPKTEWYRVLEPTKNEGCWRLMNNDINALYDEIYK